MRAIVFKQMEPICIHWGQSAAENQYKANLVKIGEVQDINYETLWEKARRLTTAPVLQLIPRGAAHA